MNQIKLSKLKNINEQSFFEELAKAPKKLVPKQESSFYHILLGYFEEPNQISDKKGKLILKMLCHCFYESKKRLSTFIKEQFHLELPYNEDRFVDQIFDILYIIAENHPEAFDDQYELGDSFRHILNLNPGKALTILNILSNNFGDIKSPWSIFNLLFKCWKKLYKVSPSSYITLILYLCRRDQGFLQGRGSMCYNRIVQLLNTENDDDLELIRILYSALCKLYDCDSAVAEEDISKSNPAQKIVSSDVIYRHIQIESLQNAIISFLLRVPLDPNDKNALKITKILINLAKQSERACYVIFKLAENENISTFLANNRSLWLIEPLLNQQNNIILLLIVLRNVQIRKKITQSSEIMTFISNTTNDDDPSYISPLMRIMHRLTINEEFVNSLSENDILTDIVSKAKILEDEDQERCALLIFSTFCKIEYKNDPPNFTSICNYAISVLKKQNSNLNHAAVILLKYAHFDQCKLLFRKKKLLDLFDDIHGDKTFNRIHQKLINEME
ncbi:hypothetical protein M9Y10_003888 [Tritrichomonas musculus]|uniref:DUF3447 domain-containing protein n=1 Tax=Tritrichomonas musculus TaxID=1915356 RepID=A0ABR2JRB4_9EUKA